YYSVGSSSADRAPELPSFPTRRSSDLMHAPAIGQRPGRVRIVAGSRLRCLGLLRTQQESGGGDGEVGMGRGCVAMQELVQVPVQDRKSTRLNSSHVKISYAVFCLKKKI